MSTDTKNVTLTISLDAYGVSGQFEVDTELSYNQWEALSHDAQDDYATSLFNENLDWYWKVHNPNKG